MNEVVVTMTSWKNRINGVSKTIFSLLENTYKPRSIELNLSEEEFIEKEKELPEDLLLLKDQGLVNINWVGRNVKTFKKLLPTVKKYYNEKDLLVMTADDDIIYPNFIIERFVALHNKYPNAFVAFRNIQGRYKTQPCPNGGATMYQISFFSDFWFNIPEKVIQTNEDDWWYAYCMLKTGGRGGVFSGIPLEFDKSEYGKHGTHPYVTMRILDNLTKEDFGNK